MPDSTKSLDTTSTPANRFWLTGLTALLVVIPAGLSAWHQNSERSLPKLGIQTTRPALLFSTHLYHHGEKPIEATSTLRTEFRFRNDGAEPVRIGQIERSCGCMKPMLSARTVNPGEIASLSVAISTINEQPGPKDFRLTLHYTDPEPRQALLTIKAVFPKEKIFVEPKALFLSQRTSSEVPFRVKVSDFREDQQLEVRSVLATADFVDATLAPMTTAVLAPTPDPQFGVAQIEQVSGEFTSPEANTVQQAGQTDVDTQSLIGTSALIEGTVAGDVPPGRHHILVAAETSDLNVPFITVPMVITGPAYSPGQEIYKSADAVDLIASEDPQARRWSNITFSAPADWEFAEAKVWPQELVVKTNTSARVVDGRATTTVEIGLDQLPADQLKHGVVSIRTKDGKNLVTVQVNFLWP